LFNPARRATADDPYFANVILYLKGDGDNDSTTIIDSSSYNKTITPGATSVIKTDQSKYGGSSLYFNGSSNSIVTVTASESTGTDDFTLESWVYFTTTDCAVARATSTLNYQLLSVVSGKLESYLSSTSYNPKSPNSFPLNQWNHIALTRQSGAIKLWENGILVGQSSLSSNTVSLAIYSIGDSFGRGIVNGYIDSFRATAGVARYTANFDPETETFLAY
jgi:hypothetical protein